MPGSKGWSKNRVVEKEKREQGTAGRPERALLAGLLFPDSQETFESPLDELSRLAETAGAAVVGRTMQRRRRPHGSTYFGKGKAKEICDLARSSGADVVIVAGDLTPAQLRNLERLLDLRVVDRTELILDIFAQHARSHQAKLQVELAQMQYIMPRLRRMWTHLSREGGTGQSGGIGTRGPGEKQIEIDRRMLRHNITQLRRELASIARRRERMAASREAYFTVSLVGYTNAGKSTLLRRLTGAEAYVADQLFATLDTQTRAWELLSGKRVFLSDTVGFIRDLPHHLVASFYATLEEVRTADLILHVVDVSHPDAGMHTQSVETVLAEIGAESTPRVLVLNKRDRVEDPLDLRFLARGPEPAVAVSARTGEGIESLELAVEEHILAGQTEVEFRVPAGAGKLLAFLADRGTVLDRAYEDGMVAVRVRLSNADLARAGRLVAEIDAATSTEE